MNPSTSQLTSLVLHGDIDWGQIVAECEPRIAAWCRRFGLQNADAADVSQDVLVKVILALRSGSFDANRGHHLSWLKAVTDNTIRSFLWKTKAKRECEFDESSHNIRDLAQEPAAITQAESDTESDEEFLNAQLQQAESCVRPRIKLQTWEAYRLTMHENLSPTLTAEKIGISVRDVYVAKCRVIGYVRRELGFDTVSKCARASKS